MPVYEGSVGYEVGYKWDCPPVTNPALKRCGLEYHSISDMAVPGIGFGDPMYIDFINQGTFQAYDNWNFEGRYSRGKNFQPIQAVVGGEWVIPYTIYTVVRTSYSYYQNGQPTQEDFSPAQSWIHPGLIGRSRILRQQGPDTLRYYVEQVPAPLPILAPGFAISFTRRLRRLKNRIENCTISLGF